MEINLTYEQFLGRAAGEPVGAGAGDEVDGMV